MQVCEVIAWPGRDWEPRLKARHTLWSLALTRKSRIDSGHRSCRIARHQPCSWQNLSLWLESLALTQCVCPKNDKWMTLFVWMKWGRLWPVVRGGRPWWNSATRSECLFVQNLTLNIASHDELLPLWLSIFYSIHCQTFRIRAVRCFAILSDFPKKKRYALECGLRIVILEAVLNCVH